MATHDNLVQFERDLTVLDDNPVRQAMSTLRSIATIVILLLVSSCCVAHEPEASRLLPSSTVLYLQIGDPASVLDELLNHPLRQRIESLDAYQSAWKKNLRQLKAVVAIVEAQLDMDWQDVVSTVTAGGLYAAVDAETNGVAVLAKSSDQAKLEKLRDVVLGLIRADANEKGNPDPVNMREYRGMQAFGIHDAKIAILDSWLLVTNQDKLGKKIVDRFLERGNVRLSDDTEFQAAADRASEDSMAWGFVDVAGLRAAGAAEDLFSGKTENILAEILVGGIQSNLQHAPFATAAVEFDEHHLSVNLATPHDREWVPEEREYYFGANGGGTAPKLIRTNSTVLSISTFREMSKMWLRGDELLREGAYDELAKAESNLSTLFSGKDFGEEVLGAVGPRFQIVVNRQDFSKILPRPAIKLPSFAGVFELRQADAMRDDLRRTFQSLIGFLNVIGSSQGQPQLDMDVQRSEQRQLVITSYVPEEDERTSDQARINFNFSPSVGFAKNRFVVSSSGVLVDELISAPQDDETDKDANTMAYVNMQVLRDLLGDNQTQLVAQNMLKEGNSKEEAQQQINTLLGIVGWFRDATLVLTASDSQLRLQLQLRVLDPTSP